MQILPLTNNARLQTQRRFGKQYNTYREPQSLGNLQCSKKLYRGHDGHLASTDSTQSKAARSSKRL